MGVILFVGRGGILLFFFSLPRTPFMHIFSEHLCSALGPSLDGAYCDLEVGQSKNG